MRITLCGSARFEDRFKEFERRLTLAGHVVYGLAVYPSTAPNGRGKNWYTPEQKRVLDQVHFAKIDNSDAIMVIEEDGYVGESTQREINHAIETGKTVMCPSLLSALHVPYGKLKRTCLTFTGPCACAVCYKGDPR